VYFAASCTLDFPAAMLAAHSPEAALYRYENNRHPYWKQARSAVRLVQRLRAVNKALQHADWLPTVDFMFSSLLVSFRSIYAGFGTGMTNYCSSLTHVRPSAPRDLKQRVMAFLFAGFNYDGPHTCSLSMHDSLEARIYKYLVLERAVRLPGDTLISYNDNYAAKLDLVHARCIALAEAGTPAPVYYHENRTSNGGLMMHSVPRAYFADADKHKYWWNVHVWVKPPARIDDEALALMLTADNRMDAKLAYLGIELEHAITCELGRGNCLLFLRDKETAVALDEEIFVAHANVLNAAVGARSGGPPL
jgi:hypothetical protein